MVQKKIPLINSSHGSETRNIINELIKLFNGMGYTYNESLQKAHDILDEAQRKSNDILGEAERVNALNENVQQQLNTLIVESGTSDAEVVQARGSYDILVDRLNHYDDELNRYDAEVVQARGGHNVLVDRLNHYDDEMDKTRGELDNLGTTTFTRNDDHTLVSIKTPTSNINLYYDSSNKIESIEEHRERNNIRTTVNRDDDGVLKSYNREEF